MKLFKKGETDLVYLVGIAVIAAISIAFIYNEADFKELDTSMVVFSEKMRCKRLYNNVEMAFDKANHCAEDMDCKTVILGGPYGEFGCFKYVNKETDEGRLFKEIEKYDKICGTAINKCAPSPNSVCIAKKCVSPEEVAEE